MAARSILIVIGWSLWIALAFAWLLSRKFRLLKKHGYDQTNADLINLGKSDDLDAARLTRDSKFFICTGVIGALAMVLF